MVNSAFHELHLAPSQMWIEQKNMKKESEEKNTFRRIQRTNFAFT